MLFIQRKITFWNQLLMFRKSGFYDISTSSDSENEDEGLVDDESEYHANVNHNDDENNDDDIYNNWNLNDVEENSSFWNGYNYYEYNDNQDFFDFGQTSSNFSCDPCDKFFFSEFELNKHLSEHKACDIDGCKFTAHEKIIEKHIKMQHQNEFFKKIQSLENPEDIAKWIAERKQRYPSKENVAKRYEKQMAMLKRGERMPKKHRFDKSNKMRFTLAEKNVTPSHRKSTKRKHNSTKINTKPKQVSLIDQKLEWNEDVFPFQGTKDLFDETELNETCEIDDEEWNDEKKTIPIKNLAPAANALSTLMEYGSSDENEDNEIPSNIEVDNKLDNENLIHNKLFDKQDLQIEFSDNEAPIEEKILREDINIGKNVDVTDLNNTESRNMSKGEKKNRKRKKTRRNNKRDKTSINNSDTSKKTSNLNGVSSAVYKKRKITLLERLLENEIRQERNVILQCVRYVVENNFFDKKVDNVTS